MSFRILRRDSLLVLRHAMLWFGIAAAAAPTATLASGLRILAYEPVELRVSRGDTSAQLKSSVPTAPSVVAFDAFGRRFTLELERNVRVDRLVGASGSAYRGRLEQNPRSWVRLTTLADGRLDALIWDGADLYAIAAGTDVAGALVPPLASPDGHLIFRLADTLIESPDAACAVEAANDGNTMRGDAVYAELLDELSAATLPDASSGATRQLQLSVIADSLYRNYAGSEQSATDQIAARLNNVDGIFATQLDLRFDVTSIEVHDPRSDPFSATTSPSVLLRELGQLRRSDSALRYTGLTHLFTGRDLDGDAVGVAYIDAVCDAQLGAAVTELRGRTTVFESLIAAHEIGHNLGAPHDGEEGACLATPQAFLMAPRINGSDRFSSCSLREIESRLVRAVCVEAVPQVDVAASTSTPTIRALPGREAIADFSIANLGDGPARAVTAYLDTRHPGLQIVAAETAGGSCTVSAALAACQLGDVAADASVDLALTMIGISTGQGTATLTVGSQSQDANAGNDVASTTVSIEDGTDLVVSLDAPASSAVSTELDLVIEASNRSQLSASDVSLSVTVASGLTITAADSAGGQCTFTIRDARCEHAMMDVGRRVTATVRARANAAGSQGVEASARAAELDLAPADNTASAQISIAAVAGTTVEARAGGGGGGGSLAPGLTWLALLLAWLRRITRPA